MTEFKGFFFWSVLCSASISCEVKKNVNEHEAHLEHFI